MGIVDYESNVVEACFHVRGVFEMAEERNGCNSEDILDFVLSMVEENLDVHGMFRWRRWGMVRIMSMEIVDVSIRMIYPSIKIIILIHVRITAVAHVAVVDVGHVGNYECTSISERSS